MSPYPPFPIFTAIGFLIHTIVFSAVGIRLLKPYRSFVFFLMGIATVLNVVNFAIIIILFYFFENTLTKTHIFIFNAVVLVPLAALVYVLSVIYFETKRGWLIGLLFAVGIIAILFSYSSILKTFTEVQPFEPAYVHPAYPKIITQSQGSGIISGILVGLFFMYHARRTTLFIKRRAVILGIGAILLGLSSLYWISTEPILYIAMNTIGPLGSLFLMLGVFFYAIPEGENIS